MEENNIKEIFIPLNTPSSKNGKQWTGSFLTSSPATHKWRRLTKDFWTENKDKFLEMIENEPIDTPLLIGMHFVRKSRHKFDFNNVTQTIQDEMVKYGWLEDDNITKMIPLPLLKNQTFFSYDKKNPGVYIKIIHKNKDNFVSLTF